MSFPTTLCGVLVFDSVSWVASLPPPPPACHTPSLPNFLTHHLSHTICHIPSLSHTIFHIQLCHIPCFTHHFSHPCLSHTTPPHTVVCERWRGEGWARDKVVCERWYVTKMVCDRWCVKNGVPKVTDCV